MRRPVGAAAAGSPRRRSSCAGSGRATRTSCSGSTRGRSPTPRAGRDGRRQPGRADGRAVVRPGRPDRRRRPTTGCSASTGPSSTRRASARCTSSRSTPEAQGRGLGRALTLAGLRHLAARGVDEVLLYVESDNAPGDRGLLAAGLHARARGHAPDVRAVGSTALSATGPRHPPGPAPCGSPRPGRPRSGRRPTSTSFCRTRATVTSRVLGDAYQPGARPRSSAGPADHLAVLAVEHPQEVELLGRSSSSTPTWARRAALMHSTGPDLASPAWARPARRTSARPRAQLRQPTGLAR